MIATSVEHPTVMVAQTFDCAGAWCILSNIQKGIFGYVMAEND